MEAQVFFNFDASNETELSVAYGEKVLVIDQSVGDGWWKVTNISGVSGFVPASYLGLLEPNEPEHPPPSLHHSKQYTFEGAQSDAWDSDEDITQPVATPVQPVLSGSQGEPVLLANIRKGFSRMGSKAGAEDFLLGRDPPKTLPPMMVIDYINNRFIWRAAPSVTTCNICRFSKSSKMKGIKGFVVYQITSSLISSHVDRRYKHFDWLYQRLESKFPFLCLPPIPEKSITNRYEEEFLEERRKHLQGWVSWMASHPVVSQSDLFRHFLSAQDEKVWKRGKREAETDPLQFIRFFYSVQTTDGPVRDDHSLKSIKTSLKFFGDLCHSLRGFHSAINDLHTKMATSYHKDFTVVSDACHSLASRLSDDPCAAKPNALLAAALSNAGGSFKSIALLQAVRSERTSQLLESVDKYIKLFACTPNTLALARSACTTSEEAVRAGYESKLSRQDYTAVEVGCRTITRSVQAECNFLIDNFRKDVADHIRYYLTGQAEAYRHVADQLEAVALSFTF